MSFFDHLEELRRRLLRCVLAIIIGFIVCFSLFAQPLYRFFSGPILKIIQKPLVFIHPADAFFMYLKICFLAGLFAVIPYVLYQCWLFIAPGLYKSERKLALPFVVTATALFYVGGAFAYLLVLPVVLRFFIGFTVPDQLEPMVAIKEYVSLVVKLMLGFGLVFETPIVLVFLGLLGIVDSDKLKKGRRYFIVIAFVIGALLSPPDVFSQILMGFPLLALYEVSIHVLVRIEKRRKAEEEALPGDGDTDDT
jgi:sec-independent protein translocase protein TatC